MVIKQDCHLITLNAFLLRYTAIIKVIVYDVLAYFGRRCMFASFSAQEGLVIDVVCHFGATVAKRRSC